MAARYKRPATDAEQARREQAQTEKLTALHDRLAEQVQALRTGPDWQAALATAARFHIYSFGNTLLIAAQRPEATAVAGYAAWQALGRHVDKGQKGIAILAPVIHRSNRPAAESDTAASGEGSDGAEQLEPGADDSAASRGSGRPVGYRVSYVWDVAQTSGQPLPETPAPQLLAGQAPDGLWAALAQVAVDRGFTVTRNGTGPANGVTNFGTRAVTVRPDLDDAQAVKTLAHELGHVLLHDRAAGGGNATTSTQLCRGVKEVEAESVAYLVAAAHGLSTEQYTFPYVTGWAASIPGSTPEQVVRDTGRRVLVAASALLATTQLAAEHDAGLELAHRVDNARDRTARLREQATAAPTAEVAVAADPGTPVEVLHAIHDAATRWYTTQLRADAPDNQRAAAMLTDRAVPPATAAAWELGYAPAGWTGLTDHLRGAGYTDLQLLDAGLGLRTARGTVVDRFRDRIMFPIRDSTAGEHVIGFLGRAVRPTDSTPKYLNSPETALYRKSDVLYGLGNPPGRSALREGARPVLVEGPLDAIAVTGTPGHIGVAACGTALTAGHVAGLEQAAGPLADRGITVALDPDPAGRDAADRAYPLLRESGAWPAAAALPAGQDPSDLARQAGQPALAAVLDQASSTPLVEVVIEAKLRPWANRLQWPEGRLAALRAAVPVLATVPPDQVAEQVSRLADRLGLDAATVSNEVLDTLFTTPSSNLPAPDHRLTEHQETARAARGYTAVQLARISYPAIPALQPEQTGARHPHSPRPRERSPARPQIVQHAP